MFSKVIRRTHMYLALFLTPWMLMYALSTLAMNHRQFFEEYYGGRPQQFEREHEQTYQGSFPEEASPQLMARQIMTSLALPGNFEAREEGGLIRIYRSDPIRPRRITFDPASRHLLVERRLARIPAVLEDLHRRRGFESEYLLDDTWGFIVDVVIFAMVFWVLSGIWMWWEMKATRLFGALCALSGMALFSFFLLTI